MHEEVTSLSNLDFECLLDPNLLDLKRVLLVNLVNLRD